VGKTKGLSVLQYEIISQVSMNLYFNQAAFVLSYRYNYLSEKKLALCISNEVIP
jgi:hypothetical protein